MLLALRADGQCLEIGWPYLAAVPADLSTWIPPATATPIHRCQGAIMPGAFDEIVAILDTDCPVVIALLLGTQFYTPIAGIVESNPGEADTDYHAVLAVGYGRDKANKFMLVRNSWGDGWGIAGCAWLAAEYLETRLYAFARMEKTL
jgi:Papain family cysteine protease